MTCRSRRHPKSARLHLNVCAIFLPSALSQAKPTNVMLLSCRKARRLGGSWFPMRQVRSSTHSDDEASWMSATGERHEGVRSGRHSRSIATTPSAMLERSSASAASASASVSASSACACRPGKKVRLLSPGAPPAPPCALRPSDSTSCRLRCGTASGQPAQGQPPSAPQPHAATATAGCASVPPTRAADSRTPSRPRPRWPPSAAALEPP
mmetsp:Transcript_29728/g.74638  ORF Transcript_29728/g.74638 Transcript_29728/m.74638 type:complete len:210 (+) Transcript_29728:751-1380(+)